MFSARSQACMKYQTIVGAAILLLPSGLHWYWGNMSVYSLSYIVSVLEHTSGVDTPWIVSSFIIFWSIGTLCTDFLSTRVGRLWTLLTGIFLLDVGVLSCYFSNQYSITLLTFTMGVLVGAGTGFIDASVLQIVIELGDNRLGMLISIAQASPAIGAIVINEFVTLYTNPLNLAPQIQIGQVKYFTQKEVLDKVPSMYLIHGAFSIGMHMLGLLLLTMRFNADSTMITSHQENHTVTKQTMGIQDESRINKLQIDYSSLDYSPLDYSSLDYDTTTSKTIAENHVTAENARAPVPECTPISDPIPSAESEARDTEVRGYYGDVAPSQMLRQGCFYAFWLSLFLGHWPFVIIVNYYKSFGQLWIDDDHFLTILGTCLILLNFFGSILWGATMDRFGVKTCLTVILSVSVVSLSWFFFTPMLNKWVFSLSTLVIGCVAGSLYPCFTAATALLFGKKHFSTNFGIVMTSILALNILAPNLLVYVLSLMGWFSLFALTASFSLIGIVLILIFVPNF